MRAHGKHTLPVHQAPNIFTFCLISVSCFNSSEANEALTSPLAAARGGV